MKRILLSILVGCILAGIVYLYGCFPSIGTNFAYKILIVPFMLAASLIPADGLASDIIYYIIQVIFYSIVCFGILSILAKFKKREH